MRIIKYALLAGLLSASCASRGAPAPSTNTVTPTKPYKETFEGYKSETPLVGGTNGWYASHEDVVAQTKFVYSGDMAAKIPFDCSLSNRFENVVSNVWMTMWVRTMLYGYTNPPPPNTNAATFFYIDTNGHFVAKNGTSAGNWTTVTKTATDGEYRLENEQWSRLDMYQDYEAGTWKLFSDYVLISDELPFVNKGVTNFNGFDLYNGQATSFLDNVEVSYAIPADLVNNGVDWLPHLRATASVISNEVNEDYCANSQTVGVYRAGGYYGLVYDSYVSAGSEWMSINSTGGTSEGETNWISISYNTIYLSRGVHTGKVTLVGRMEGFGTNVFAVNSPTNIEVRMTIAHPLPSVAVDPTVLNATIQRGANAGDKTFQVWNGSGNYTLRYTIAREASNQWISIGAPSVGTITGSGETNRARIGFLTADLDYGTHTGRVIVSGTDLEYGDTVPERQVQVMITVLGQDPPATISASDGTYRDRVMVHWPNAGEEVYGYEVRRGTTPDPAVSQLQAIIGVTNYADMNTEAGQPYYYWVRSVNLYGYAGSYGPHDIGFRGIAAPATMTASDGASTESVRVAWSPASSATDYLVYRNTIMDSNTAVLVTSVPATNCYDVPPQAGVLYYYWVKSKNAFSTSDFSVGDSGYVGLTPPGNVDASYRTYTNSIAVTWRAVSNSAVYEIWRNTSSNRGTAAKIGETGALMYDDSNCAAEVDYYYWIRARNDIAQSAFSDSAVGKRRAPGTPSAPGWVSASDGTFTNVVRVTWATAADAASYEVWRSLQNETGSAALLAGTEGLLYDDASVTGGVTYFYWVKGINPNGASAFSPCDSGYGAIAGSSNADLSITNLVFLPAACAPEGNPGRVSFRLKNAGPAAMSGGNRRVTVEFFCTTNSALDKPLHVWLGNLVAEPVLAPGESEAMVLSDSDLAALRMPSAAGAYNVFARVHHSYPSELADPVLGNNTVRRIAPVKVKAAGGVPYRQVNDYNGDKISDLAVYNEAAGSWFILDMNSGKVVTWDTRWGGAGFATVFGDYDNDGRADMAVYGADTGRWFILSSAGSVIAWDLEWGGAGMLAVPGDFDGDGRSDMAVYNEASGNWSIQTVQGRIIVALANWGGPGMLPVPGDFLGDGAASIAIYSQAGYWFIREAQKGASVLAWQKSWGRYNMVPVSGDFDGDGIADMAVYDTTTGFWYIRALSGTLLLWAHSWGGADFTPVSGDFDGDGVSDIAVYHEATGTWYAWSLDGRILAWGTNWGGLGYAPVR